MLYSASPPHAKRPPLGEEGSGWGVFGLAQWANLHPGPLFRIWSRLRLWLLSWGASKWCRLGMYWYFCYKCLSFC